MCVTDRGLEGRQTTSTKSPLTHFYPVENARFQFRHCRPHRRVWEDGPQTRRLRPGNETPTSGFLTEDQLNPPETESKSIKTTLAEESRMSLMISRADGVTVFTVTSNPKSKWPLICQLLGTLCYSPVCSVSQSLKQKMGSFNKVLGVLQILFGVLNVAVWSVFTNAPALTYVWDSVFWFGGVLIAAGIICILADKFPSPCLVSFMVLVNVVSAGLAVSAIVFCAVDLRQIYFANRCNPPDYLYGHYYGQTTVSPLKRAQINEQQKECENYQDLLRVVEGGVDIMMLVFSSLQICLAISSSVLSLKALCKKKKGDEMEDPEFYKPLVEEGLTSPTR
ncbi:hypothetical protein AOLI_G00254740 [Acnodon oligacanthus]